MSGYLMLFSDSFMFFFGLGVPYPDSAHGHRGTVSRPEELQRGAHSAFLHRGFSFGSATLHVCKSMSHESVYWVNDQGYHERDSLE